MDYGKMTKDELISKLNSLKSKLEGLENKKSEGERRTPEKILRESMEKELIKAQKLESIGVFARGIAHDFNNSLQTILGYISLAKIRTNPNEEIYEFLEEAGKAVLQSRDLTHQLLTFSKGGTPVKETVSITELFESATKVVLSGSNVRHELIIPEGLWHIEADRGLLSQVISNIIINADQAMPEGGNIKILAENINGVEKDSLPLQEGRYIKITVEDLGTGIAQEHLQRVFDPYFTTKQEGNGLGLANAYSIVKRHDGHITVESEIGIGTTFHIYLPAS
jgi:PAS/PAC sensor hybrid histidine kinase (EC 2.7.3.-)